MILISEKKVWGAVLLGGVFSLSIFAGQWDYQKKLNSRPVTIYAWRIPSGPIFLAEDPNYPELQEYRQQEHLDRVVAPYHSDFEQILALDQWASRQFKATTPFPHYPPWNARIILDRIRHGKTGGFCAQYGFVFGQACQSFGYLPRYVDISSHDNSGGHFTTEVFVPSLNRWIVFEPEWGIYYVDESGQPLDALQLHRVALGLKKGKVIQMPTHETADPAWLRQFFYFRYYLRNNFLSIPVFMKRWPDNEITFAPYRLAWLDSYTNDPRNTETSIVSSRADDFEAPVHPSNDPVAICKSRSDIYATMTSEIPFVVRQLSIPYGVLLQLIKKDFLHDPTYHRLKA